MDDKESAVNCGGGEACVSSRGVSDRDCCMFPGVTQEH